MLPLSPHRLVLAALVVTLLAAAVVARAGQTGGASQAAPAGLPLPALPGIEEPDPSLSPSARPLERDGVLVDRFTAPGQRVGYPFRAQAGELSLFELAAAGYARGWTMAAALRVLGPDGGVLAECSRSGGVQLQAFLAFVAPASGDFVLEVVPTEQFFRYALVRHSRYAPRVSAPREIGQRERIHGWLADDADRALYRVPVRAGEQLALSVEGSRDEARAERRRLLGQESEEGTATGMPGMQARHGLGYPRPPRRFPLLRMEVLGGVRPRSSSPAFALLAPADADGFVQVAVGVAPGEPGGLFDLVLRRDPPGVPVGGLVVDADDQPLAGVRLRLLLEPDLEPWGETATDAGGAWGVRVPPGDYRVELRRPGVEALQAASVGVSGDTELNLLWRGP